MVKKRSASIVAAVVVFALLFTPLMGTGVRWWWIAALGGAGIALVVFFSRRGRHTPWAKASLRVAPGHAVVFWKPGCIFCERLLLAVGRNDRVTWVNVWADEEANAEVRRLNNGDELTPTAVVGERVLRNPSAAEMLAAVAGS
ncbi:MAG: hypothetical protein Q4P15_10780 [Propionibacteriaceae bacterium]|nr:hypothetical protein [Propionibacteriaceae bacterium]